MIIKFYLSFIYKNFIESKLKIIPFIVVCIECISSQKNPPEVIKILIIPPTLGDYKFYSPLHNGK